MCPKGSAVAIKGRRPRHIGLIEAEIEDLKALYANYYTETGGLSLQDLLRMYELERRGTDEQIADLLKKYGRTLDEEFD